VAGGQIITSALTRPLDFEGFSAVASLRNSERSFFDPFIFQFPATKARIVGLFFGAAMLISLKYNFDCLPRSPACDKRQGRL
jgi:hypothetical protein